MRDFGEAHGDDARAALIVCGLESSRLRASAGFFLDLAHGLDALGDAQVIFIPSWRIPYEPPPPALTAALAAAHRAGAIVVGLCLGAFVLAEAGLLDGKRATTHWAFADAFRERFPNVALDETALFVDEGAVLTSAGVAAGVDCCLHLARRLFGSAPANRIARNILALPYRAGGQTQFIERPLAADARDARILQTLDQIVGSLGAGHTLDSAARAVAMSRRNFSRHVKKLMGLSFGEWLTNERLEKARAEIEGSGRAIDLIAHDAGFASSITFRARFRARHGVSPARWRKSLRDDADA